MKVLILADIPGWIVDRIADRMIAGMPSIEFVKRYYACTETNEILRLAGEVDLVHYLNWDIAMHWPALQEIWKKLLLSIRSHRYPDYVPNVAGAVRQVHVVSETLREKFPGSRYIPDGVMIEPRPLRVGWAGKPCAYKGNATIEKVCREIGAEFKPAIDLPADRMTAYYDSIDVLVCFSEAEGFCAPVMEALALNKPVISTECGAAWERWVTGVMWVERHEDDLKDALYLHWPARMIGEMTWQKVCPQFERLYHVLVD